MISIVVPIYNEEAIIPLFHAAVVDAMAGSDEDWEIVYVNDGSTDSSLELLQAVQNQHPHVTIVDLSRNWGHMGALSAGLRTAKGDAVVLMDGDFQDPPEVVPQLLAAWQRGAKPGSRPGDSSAGDARRQGGRMPSGRPGPRSAEPRRSGGRGARAGRSPR